MDKPIHSNTPTRIGIVGAGTMGRGIALAALLADLRVILYDVSQEMLVQAREYIQQHLNRKHRAISFKYLRLATDLDDLHGCEVVIEAAPEDLALKKNLFAQLESICPPPAILATNTSTLPVTNIAAGTETPERVAGMHFFNPAPVLPLVEVVRGARTAEQTVQALVRLAERMGKTPVVAGDTPGFIVNRVARPFYGEALRLLGEGAATVEEIDRLVRESGGFRMGPFELMDLIGIDVNLAAAQSIYEQSFYEPRYRPHRIQAQMVGQKALGRKTGRGFYPYEQSGQPEKRQEEKTPSLPTKDVSREEIVYLSPGSWAPGLAGLCREAGFILIDSPNAAAELRDSTPVRMGIVSAGQAEGLPEQVQNIDRLLPPEVPILCQCVEVSLVEVANWLENPGRLVGFDGLFFTNGPSVTLVSSPELTSAASEAIDTFLIRLGRSPVWIEDVPGLVLPRLVCALANEAAFAAGEGVAEVETIDLAMQLGTNYPRGPLAWAKEIGYAKVVAVLDHLRDEYGEERYRIAPLLRRWARLANRPINL